MPLYEYYCRDCSATFEMLRPKREADTPAKCRRCQSLKTARTISLFAAHGDGQALAGSGGGCSGCTPSSGCATCRSR